eukprot:TRINITY_DN70283_c0_g1_i1.p1 TRINITY_DN70283_c0_g1~~TRINITY_DN70283_c0_g1_i1.p1  ORF type:complete len:626 (-),score=141.61 TRINITY_DN70283_c0_g1_i1:151-2028(-)
MVGHASAILSATQASDEINLAAFLINDGSTGPSSWILPHGSGRATGTGLGARCRVAASFSDDHAAKEEARQEPAWQDLVSKFYRDRLAQARATERDAALQKVVEERKIGRAKQRSDEWQHDATILREAETNLKKKPQTTETAEELLNIKDLIDKTLKQKLAANAAAVEASNRLHKNISRQVAAIDSEKRSMTGVKEATADMDAKLREQTNRTAGRPAVNTVGQVISSRESCNEMGMEFVEGQGCFVPGKMKKPSTEEVAAAKVVAAAQQEEQRARETVRSTKAEFDDAQANLDALLKDTSTPQEAVMVAQGKLTDAEYKLKSAQSVLASQMRSIIKAEENQLAATKQEAEHDAQSLQQALEEERQASAAAAGFTKDAARVERLQASRYSDEAKAAGRSGGNAEGDEAELTKAAELALRKRAEHSKAVADALDRGDLASADSNMKLEKRDEQLLQRTRRDLDAKSGDQPASPTKEPVAKEAKQEGSNAMAKAMREEAAAEAHALKVLKEEPALQSRVNQDALKQMHIERKIAIDRIKLQRDGELSALQIEIRPSTRSWPTCHGHEFGKREKSGRVLPDGRFASPTTFDGTVATSRVLPCTLWFLLSTSMRDGLPRRPCRRPVGHFL